MPTIAAAVQDSGAIDIGLEEHEEGDENPMEAYGDNRTEPTDEEIVVAGQDSVTAVQIATEKDEPNDGSPTEVCDNIPINAKLAFVTTVQGNGSCKL